MTAESWTPTTIFCYESQHDCQNCSVFRFYGMERNTWGLKRCRMPESIRELLVKGVKFPSVKQRNKIMSDFS